MCLTMMLYPAMNKLTSYVPNRYMLVNVVARRARQIADAADAAGEPLDEKPVTMAINEVAQGKLDASSMNLTIEED
jgi:DNA-directed RNA polymerase subunit omega